MSIYSIPLHYYGVRQRVPTFNFASAQTAVFVSLPLANRGFTLSPTYLGAGARHLQLQASASRINWVYCSVFALVGDRLGVGIDNWGLDGSRHFNVSPAFCDSDLCGGFCSLEAYVVDPRFKLGPRSNDCLAVEKTTARTANSKVCQQRANLIKFKFCLSKKASEIRRYLASRAKRGPHGLRFRLT